MAGPVMGPRPLDFDEEVIRKSPTFRKWMDIPPGGKLRYACRDFIKGHEDDEERLMRRIMIARRNNIRDHEQLKQARQIVKKKQQNKKEQGETEKTNNGKAAAGYNNIQETNDNLSEGSTVSLEEDSASGRLMNVPSERKRRYSTVFSDAEVAREMDVPAVEATRSYKAWAELPDGSKFQYNQTYIKGADGHDWLLRKNIWRRMRYRRENRKLVENVLQEEKVKPKPTFVKVRTKTRIQQHKSNVHFDTGTMNPPVRFSHGITTASQIVDHALLSTTAGAIARKNVAGKSNSSLQHHQHPPRHDSHEKTLESTAAEVAASIPHDPDTDAVVEAAVAAGENYANSPFVNNPLESSVDGLGLALDVAAHLAAAKAASLETDEAILAAAMAGQPSQESHQSHLPIQQPLSEEDRGELTGDVMDYLGNA
ncbi:hypothetical protein IV203_031566 [Nitzschia inconspicua]|uniref:Uncharacterized protein n=1 Tax=Nitzschia inconspicua TaxID=303405 RepID=A0A9K3LVI5_9STRA|nr:hypothetical protein IV203_031566 [Nitzschia inconspicua]